MAAGEEASAARFGEQKGYERKAEFRGIN